MADELTVHIFSQISAPWSSLMGAAAFASSVTARVVQVHGHKAILGDYASFYAIKDYTYDMYSLRVKF